MKKLRKAFIVSVAMACATCAAQVPLRKAEDILLARAEKAGEESSSKLEALEPKALASVGSNAQRHDSRLTLRLKSGKLKSYSNLPTCKIPDEETKCEAYALVDHLVSRDIFIVAKFYYESAEFLLIDDTTGDESILPAFPAISPSGIYALVLNADEAELGFAVEVWRRQGSRFILAWKGSPHSAGIYTTYELLGWPSENHIVLQAKASFEPPKPDCVQHFDLVLATDRWKIIDRP